MSLTQPDLGAKVRVYSKDNCVQCTLTKNLLDAHGVPYSVEDITDPVTIEILRADGFLAAPVVKVGDGPEDMWAGFQPDKIKALAARLERGEL